MVSEPWDKISNLLKPIIQSSNKIDGIIRLINGGILYILSSDNPNSLRSKGFDLIIFDEMAFADERAWEAIRPTLADRQGRLLGISSPNGATNWFYDLFNNAKRWDDWQTEQLTWRVAPHLTQSEMDKAKEEMGIFSFRQEFEAEFLSKADALFNPKYFENILVNEIPTSFYKSTIGVDPNHGVSLKSDFSAIVFAGCHTEENQIIYVDCNMERRDFSKLLDDTMAMFNKYQPTGILFESNMWQKILGEMFIKKYSHPVPVYQIHQKENKLDRIMRLSSYFEKDQINILNNHSGRELVRQLRDIPTGKNDDGADALELAVRGLYMDLY